MVNHNTEEIRLLENAGRVALAAALGDSPETVISVHLLRRGLCRAAVVGLPERPLAAVIQANALPSEPTAFADDAALVQRLLSGLEGWSCVNVPLPVGLPLARLIDDATSRPCRLHVDVYHVLARPVVVQDHPAVRRLTLHDLPLLEATGSERIVNDWGFGSAAVLLSEGHAAGAIVENRLVGVAYTGAISGRHADLGVVTLEPWRGRGFSTAAASLVCAAIQSEDRTPVWSTGQDNVASLRVASKLGFVESTRRVYVIPESTR